MAPQPSAGYGCLSLGGWHVGILPGMLRAQQTEASSSSQQFLCVPLLLWCFVWLCFMRRVKLGLGNCAGDKPSGDRWIDSLCWKGCVVTPLCQPTKVTCSRGTTLRAEDRLRSLRSMQPFAFLLRLSSKRPHCGGFYKNSEPSARLLWTTHYSSDDTVF